MLADVEKCLKTSMISRQDSVPESEICFYLASPQVQDVFVLEWTFLIWQANLFQRQRPCTVELFTSVISDVAVLCDLTLWVPFLPQTYRGIVPG